MTKEEWIHEVVDAFYLVAKEDVLIGYHFRIIKDFDTHIPRIATFWEIQLLGGTQKTLTSPFDIMNIHVPLHIKRGELGRWMVLFRKTLNEKHHDAHSELATLWRERLEFFESAFLRFFGL
jgi:hemoglobin